ncbi:hypothetical protein DENSPDRAFT_841827 [Dentipellis sp. KUC8613]|nr:hypothetical protein DENSPDRAFT_841827 [Dentipellis sp. KUC8613]
MLARRRPCPEDGVLLFQTTHVHVLGLFVVYGSPLNHDTLSDDISLLAATHPGRLPLDIVHYLSSTLGCPTWRTLAI